MQNITTTLKKLFYVWRRSQVPVKQPIRISQIDNLIMKTDYGKKITTKGDINDLVKIAVNYHFGSYRRYRLPDPPYRLPDPPRDFPRSLQNCGRNYPNSADARYPLTINDLDHLGEGYHFESKRAHEHANFLIELSNNESNNESNKFNHK